MAMRDQAILMMARGVHELRQPRLLGGDQRTWESLQGTVAQDHLLRDAADHVDALLACACVLDLATLTILDLMRLRALPTADKPMNAAELLMEAQNTVASDFITGLQPAVQAVQTTRRSGRTSDQMRAAPRCSFFVWGSKSGMSYAHQLAKHLLRDDLLIITPSEWWRANDVYKLASFVVDHDAWSTMTAMEIMHWDRLTKERI